MKKTIILLCILLCITTGCAKKTDAPFGAETAGTTEAIESTSTTVPETQNKPELPTEQQEQKVSFLACGDNMVFYGNIRDAASQAGNYKYNFAPHYHNVKDIITAADISMINQETLMSSLHEYSYYPHFNSPREMGYALQDTGFDIVSIANNHMLDKGAEGLRSTIDFWNTQKVTLIGGYTSQDDCNNIRIVEKNGVKIAFLAYTEHTNGISAPAEGGVFIPYLSEEVLTKQISIAKNNADFVIISTHWGDEYTFTPNDNQHNYAQIMTDAGADAIIGHHPHVIQPIEWLTAPDGSRTLCVYSLGNFVAEQAADFNMLGGMIGFDMVKNGDTLTLNNVVFTPTVYYFDTNFYNNRVLLLSQFTDELAESHGISYYENTITVDGIKQYLNQTINKEFLKQ